MKPRKIVFLFFSSNFISYIYFQGTSNVVYNGSFFYYSEEKEAIGKNKI